MQGQSGRQECPRLILKNLLEQKEMSFEELVSILRGTFSRGTVNKYLTELYDNGFVSREGRRGKYSLTHEGKKEVVRRYGVISEKALNDYLSTIIQLAHEGHARILTKEEEGEDNFPIKTGLPLEIDEKGLRQFGMTEGQIVALRIVQEAANNLKKQGINVRIQAKGTKSNFMIGMIGAEKSANHGEDFNGS